MALWHTPHCCGCRQTPPHPTAALPFLFPPLHVMWARSQVSDAIPIPGLLEGLAPSVQAARTASSSANSGGGGGVATVAAVPVALAAAAAAAAAPALVRLPQQDAELLSGAGLALEQVASVVNEARAGLRMMCMMQRGVVLCSSQRPRRAQQQEHVAALRLLRSNGHMRLRSCLQTKPTQPALPCIYTLAGGRWCN